MTPEQELFFQDVLRRMGWPPLRPVTPERLDDARLGKQGYWKDVEETAKLFADARKTP